MCLKFNQTGVGSLSRLKKDEVEKVEEQIEQTVSEMETVFIYCGPTNAHIARYTSYKNGYPIHLNEHLEKCPTLKTLFVEPENFAEFEKNVAEKGTAENIWFDEVKNYFSKAVS
jgi:hypothetical protein